MEKQKKTEPAKPQIGPSCENCKKLRKELSNFRRDATEDRVCRELAQERAAQAREREDQARQAHLDAARLEQQHIQHNLTQSLKRAQDDCVRLQSQLGESQRRIRDLEDLLRNAEHRIAAGIATLAVGPKNST